MKKNDNVKLGMSYLAYLPCVLWSVFMSAIFIYLIAASVSTPREIFSGTVFKFESGIHWDTYKTAWSTQNLGRYFINSIIYSVIGVAGGLVISAPAAYVLSRYKFFGNGLIRRTLVLAMSIPNIMIILPVYGMLVKWDFRNAIALCLCYIFGRVPFSTIFLMNFFENISRTYEEAAALDGCPDSKIFTKIMLPMVRPAIITVSMFGFLSLLNEYFISLILINDKAYSTLAVGLNSVINTLKYNSNYPAIFAAIILTMLPSIIFFVIASKKIMYGGMGGGIKG